MSKVVDLEFWVSFIFTPVCLHPVDNVNVQLSPKLDMATLSEAFAKTDKPYWCSECGKDKVAPIEPTGVLVARRRFTRIAKFDCGHVSRAGVDLDDPQLVKPLAAIAVGDEISCSECSTDKAKELEDTNAIDMDSATKRYHDAVAARAAEKTPAAKPVEFLTEEEAKAREPA